MNTIKNFVFSSVGDNTDFDTLWINESMNMNYDVYVIYYGNDEDIYNKYKSKVKFIEKRKGSKFQNFKYFYDKKINIIQKYNRFFILDDDIRFGVDDINNMFNISREFDLDICAPSFSEGSKISHNITKHKPNTLLTYTSFVEVNTPLFNTVALNNLMKKLDYSLIGWGIDFLYILCNGVNKTNSYAIIHSITCENPQDRNKKLKCGRELTKITGCNNRAQIWKDFAKKHGLPIGTKITNYKTVTL